MCQEKVWCQLIEDDGSKYKNNGVESYILPTSADASDLCRELKEIHRDNLLNGVPAGSLAVYISVDAYKNHQTPIRPDTRLIQISTTYDTPVAILVPSMGPKPRQCALNFHQRCP